jgi:spore coat protein U-like protein
MKRHLFLISSVLVLAPTLSLATSANTNFGVQATVSSNCSISATSLNFNTYDPLSATNDTAASTVTITCTKGTSPTIGLNNGLNFASSTRNLKNGSDLLAYSLFKPSANTPGAACVYTSPAAWGNSGGDLFSPTAAPSTAPRVYNVCGQITAGQDVPASATNYTDTVTATVNF